MLYNSILLSVDDVRRHCTHRYCHGSIHLLPAVALFLLSMQALMQVLCADTMSLLSRPMMSFEA
jgi:hypothetical protein